MDQYLKFFLLAGITWGLIWGLMNLPELLFLGPLLYLGMLLLGSFLFGLGMLIYSYFLDFRKIEKLPYKDEYDTNSVRHEKLVVLKMKPNETFQKATEAIGDLEKGKLENVDSEMGIIEAREGKSLFRTFKNRVTVNMRGNEEGTGVRIKSEPDTPTAILDSGKNMINVETIRRYLLEKDRSID